jgi:hypothetical protein
MQISMLQTGGPNDFERLIVDLGDKSQALYEHELAESDFTYLILLKLLLPCYFTDHDLLATLVYNLIKLGLRPNSPPTGSSSSAYGGLCALTVAFYGLLLMESGSRSVAKTVLTSFDTVTAIDEHTQVCTKTPL